MGFLSPWFFAGLAAIAVPVYVHMLQQHKTTPLPFSSLMFFERRTQSSVKHRRLKYLALLAMRALVIALLAFAFAGFYVGCSTPAADRNGLTIVAIDRSLSMKAANRLERAKAQAASIAASARGPVQVLSFDSQTSVVTQPVTDKAAVRSAIGSVEAGDGRSSYGSVARAIASIAQASPEAVQAHILTDIQRTSLPSPFSELALPAKVKLAVHSVVDKQEPNWYVESVMAPRHVYQPDRVRVQATVAGSATPEAELNASAVLNGRVVESKGVKLTPGGRATVEFSLSEIPHGFSRGEIRIAAADVLAQDNATPFAIERKETRRVLLVGSARSALYYRTAMESVPQAGFVVDHLSAEQAANAGFDRYAFVVLADVAAAPEALSRYVERGGGLLVALGPASAARGRVPVSGEQILESRYATRSGERFRGVASVDAAHPALADAGGLETVKFYQVVRVDPGSSRVLARLDDGSPLITEKKAGEGRVLVFASTLDNIANDLPLHGAFVPLVEATARYLSGWETAPADFTVGSFVELRSARDSGVGVEVIGPEGRRELALSESVKLPSFQLPREGFFEFRRANGRNEMIAAHADRRESDLELIPAETLALWQNTEGEGTPGGGGGDIGDERRSLWWYFALALLILSIAESLFASRYLAAEKKPQVRRQAA